MSVKVTLVLNDPVVDKLDSIKDPAQRAAAVRDVLLSSADEIVGQVAREGLVHGTTITKRVGMTHDGECSRDTEGSEQYNEKAPANDEGSTSTT